MTQAPERIITSACGKQIVQDGMKRFDTDIEWVRLDHHKVAVAVENEACAGVAYVTCAKTRHVTLGLSAEAAIRARTPDDAKAALDKLLQEARNEALREAARLVDCACENKAKVAALPAKNSGERWRLCGAESCGAIEAAAILELITEDQSDDG